MPGSVGNAAPAVVMPASLCRAFFRTQESAVLENEYPDASSQRAKLAETSRKSWRLAKRLTPTLLAELRTFYQARRGETEPFYFYDPWETQPKFSHDPTGASSYGLYTVRFAGEWNQSAGMARADVEVSLIELA